MSAELAPVGPPAGPQGRVSRIDGERLAMFREEMTKGHGREAAWARVCTDERIGLLKYRGASSIPAKYVRQSLARMLARVAPGELAAARDSVVETIARAAPKAAATIAGLVEKCDDPRGDTVRLAASRLTLETVGLGRGAPATVLPVALGPLATFIAAQKAKANAFDRPLEVTPCSVVSTEPVSHSTHNPK